MSGFLEATLRSCLLSPFVCSVPGYLASFRRTALPVSFTALETWSAAIFQRCLSFCNLSLTLLRLTIYCVLTFTHLLGLCCILAPSRSTPESEFSLGFDAKCCLTLPDLLSFPFPF